MRIDHIEERVKAAGCDAYEITERRTNRWEFYFIRHRLDQNRICELCETEVKVYRLLDGGRNLGCAAGVISPTAGDEEIDAALKKLMHQAELMPNPAYTLNSPEEAADAEPYVRENEGFSMDGEVSAKKLNSRISEDFIRAVRGLPETATEDVNSYEIFVSTITRSYRNSRGVNNSCTYPASNLEIVVNARREDHEIELYRFFESGTCDPENLAAELARVFSFGRDRLRAEPTPKLSGIDVVLSTADAVEIYDYFKGKTSAAYVYRKLSDWEIGQRVCGPELSLEALPFLENSPENFDVDEEGARIRRRWLIKDGKVENFWGSRQFSSYLGLKGSSIVHNVAVSGGRSCEEQLRSGDFLEIVEFSDFQVDPFTGDIAGEIRLGYLHVGGEVRIVTGGSVSGQMSEAAKSMDFSDSTALYGTWRIPAVTRLKGLRIAGVEKTCL